MELLRHAIDILQGQWAISLKSTCLTQQALLVPPSMLHLKGWKIAKTLQKKVLEGDFRSQWPRQCVQWVEGIILHLWQFSWLDLTMF